MKAQKISIIMLLFFFLPPPAYAMKRSPETRGIFTMLTKSRELLAKGRAVLSSSNETTNEISKTIKDVQEALATDDRSATQTKRLLKYYLDIVSKAMLMSCKEYAFFDELGKDIVSNFDSSMPAQINNRYKTAKGVADSLEKLYRQIVNSLLEK